MMFAFSTKASIPRRFVTFYLHYLLTRNILSVDEKHLEEIQTRSLEAILLRQGFNRNFPRRITHGPQAWGGLGILDIETEDGLSQIKEFRHAI